MKITKEILIEFFDRYDRNYELNSGEIIQAIDYYDFGKVSEELMQLIESYKIESVNSVIQEVSEKAKTKRVEYVSGSDNRGNIYSFREEIDKDSILSLQIKE